jgi:tetratricopeptide (TPR) repeat protein
MEFRLKLFTFTSAKNGGVPCVQAADGIKELRTAKPAAKTRARGMSGSNLWVRLLAVPVLVFMGPSLSLAQATPLGALREWMSHTEDAAKFQSKGDYAEAEKQLNLAIKEIRPYLPNTLRIMARSYCELARVLYHEKRYAEAEPLARWALSVREADKKTSPDALFQCVYVLGLIETGLKHHSDAEPLLKRAIELQEQNLGANHVNSALIFEQLAVVYIEQEKFAAAEPLYLRSIAIQGRKTPDTNLDLAETAERYADLLKRMKRADDAAKWQARALTIRDNVATRAAKAKADRVQKEFQGFR